MDFELDLRETANYNHARKWLEHYDLQEHLDGQSKEVIDGFYTHWTANPATTKASMIEDIKKIKANCEEAKALMDENVDSSD